MCFFRLFYCLRLLITAHVAMSRMKPRRARTGKHPCFSHSLSRFWLWHTSVTISGVKQYRHLRGHSQGSSHYVFVNARRSLVWLYIQLVSQRRPINNKTTMWRLSFYTKYAIRVEGKLFFSQYAYAQWEVQ